MSTLAGPAPAVDAASVGAQLDAADCLERAVSALTSLQHDDGWWK